MQKSFKIILILSFFVLTLSAQKSYKTYYGAGDSTHKSIDEDRTLSPYFFVLSDNSETDQLPLLLTDAEVNIAGVIADVRVTQVYKNEGREAIEALYVFPASSQAAVYGMQMTIGDRIIKARINEREAARKEYEDAKISGKSASLLEQERPNVFQMNVANIMPGDSIVVELFYTELMKPVEGIYEFVYPTVVGPRYSNQSASSHDGSSLEEWIENPYHHSGEKPSYLFNISVNLSCGLPISSLLSTTHNIDVNWEGSNMGIINLAQSEGKDGNRDFILQYRLSGDKIESGLLLYEGEEENYFLLMAQPPQRLNLKDIPRREYIFVVDVSGSMNGFPLDISKKLLKDLIGNLRSSDLFNMLFFAGGNSLLSEESLIANSTNIQKALKMLDNQRGGGGTELLPALNRALKLTNEDNLSRTIVVITDGYVSVEKEAFELIRNSLGEANLFAFGIGSSVNRYIIEGMANAGMGEPYVITDPKLASKKADDFKRYVENPVLTNIDIDFEDFDVYDIEPLSIPDVFSERPVILYGKYRGDVKGKVEVKGISGSRDYNKEIKIGESLENSRNNALKYLWARKRIQVLSDYNRIQASEYITDEIRELGIRYNLLTEYTSFVAIDSEIRNNGRTTTVKQPLPLPAGVSDYAVSGGLAMSKSKAPYSRGVSMQQNILTEALDSEIKNDVIVKKEVVKAVIDDIAIDGTISNNKIEKLLNSLIPKFNKCNIYDEIGILTIKIDVDSKGNFDDVKIISKNILEDLSKCIVDIISGFNVDTKHGGEVKIRILFK